MGMLPSFMRKPYTRLRFPRIDDHGTEVIDYQATPVTAVVHGSLQPGTGLIDLVNRDGAEIAYTLLATPNADVHHDDQFELFGERFFVNGEPERWSTGIMDHVVIRLSRWVG